MTKNGSEKFKVMKIHGSCKESVINDKFLDSICVICCMLSAGVDKISSVNNGECSIRLMSISWTFLSFCCCSNVLVI